MSEYPRETKLESEELKNLILEKSKLVNEGRAVSVEIEKIEEEMEDVNKKLMEEEKKVDLSEFFKKEKAITKRMEKCIKDIDAVKMAIYEKMRANTPPELKERYDVLNKQKEEKETERNKIALAAQKYNDKIVPLGRELMKPLLQDEYEDYDTILVENGEIKATVFSHLQDFKDTFNSRKK